MHIIHVLSLLIKHVISNTCDINANTSDIIVSYISDIYKFDTYVILVITCACDLGADTRDICADSCDTILKYTCDIYMYIH